jgi:hypothetical protein
MNASEVPVGMVVTIGHSGNGRLAVKTQSGQWMHLHDGSVVDPEDFRAGWDLYLPQDLRDDKWRSDASVARCDALGPGRFGERCQLDLGHEREHRVGRGYW